MADLVKLFGESGHEMEMVSMVWANKLQTYVAVVVHGGFCPGCLLEVARG